MLHDYLAALLDHAQARRAEALFEASEDDDTRQSILKQYERLTSPEEMGALFKVLAITSDRIPAGTMPGFAVARPDLR